MLTSEVKFYNGRPTLFIEGKPVPAMGYVTYLPERNSYKQFGDAGYRIFSVVTNFGGQPINTITNVGPMEPGIFREKGKENYSSFDKTVTQLISEVPEAVIFPRVNCSMPLWWEEENPDECNFEGLNGNPPRSCFASDAYRTEAKRMLKKFIEHIKNAPYSEHIFGIQIAGGMTEEFLSYDRKGNDGKRAREKFAAENPNGNETDYRRFLSRMTAEVVEDLAKFAKEATGFTMVIGAFYGYVFETLSWKSGHHALRKLIDSPYIDFFASPISYVNRKNPGRSWFIMTPQASHSAHGKIYLGDIGEAFEDGTFSPMGRKKDVIAMSNGNKLYCDEMDEELTALEGVQEACVIYSGGKVVAVVVVADEVEEDSIRKNLKQYNKMQPYFRKIDAIWMRKEPLPRAGLGKLKRNVVMQEYEEKER